MEEEKIQEKHRAQEEQATQQRASILGLGYLDMRPLEDTIELVDNMLNVGTMRDNYIIPLRKGGGTNKWQFAVTTQTPQTYLKELHQKYVDDGQGVEFLLISDSSYRKMMTRYDPVVPVVHDNIEIASEGDSETLQNVSKTLDEVGSDEVFDYLIDQADRLGASDIHVENQRTDIRIRMRVDGVLHPVANINKDRYRVILGALASRANISTASRKAQSGHIQKEINRDGTTHLLNLRVEVIPTMYGQDAVMRLFNFDETMLNLDRLNITPADRKQVDEIISHPRGMVLMVGPTGSGKSTTLYSMINALNNPSRKIITLEDPIEYGISGITQIPINTGEDESFADGLRSVLRLDPDVVMIGEIRDADAARTAIQASITGHLVLSSFHANSTSAAFSRMVDLIGVNPIFSTAIRLVIAQRLLRRLDDDTKEAYSPDDATRRWVQEALKDLPPDIEKPDFNNFQLWRPVKSEASPFGYKGRMVIMEQMVVGEKIQAFLRGDEEVHTENIEKAARQDGMMTLLERGVLAALRGETTLDEVNRVI